MIHSTSSSRSEVCEIGGLRPHFAVLEGMMMCVGRNPAIHSAKHTTSTVQGIGAAMDGILGEEDRLNLRSFAIGDPARTTAA